MTKTHRMTGSPTYKTWLKMKERCTNPKAIQWKWYGGSGVTVCKRWLESFEAFLADMGERPSRNYSIDRLDTHGNYEPGNCRWATQKQQIDNQKKTIWVELNGSRITLRDACRQAGVPFLRAYARFCSGHDLQAVLAQGDRRFNAERGQ